MMAEDTPPPADPMMTRRALVVDDEREIRRLVRRVIQPHGIEVDEAGDGCEGLRRAEATAYDVILLDLHLPGLDGMSVLHRLLSSRPGQAVIMSSCQSDSATRTACLRAGARDFLAKPFSLVELCTQISVACGLEGLLDSGR